MLLGEDELVIRFRFLLSELRHELKLGGFNRERYTHIFLNVTQFNSLMYMLLRRYSSP
jgi:hypothetical protein